MSFDPAQEQPTIDHFRSIPKVELHRHLEGSIRLTTLMEIGRFHNMQLPGTGKLRELVQVGKDDRYNFENFLSKFQTLRMFYRSPEAIIRLTREAIQDAAIDNVRYLELRFTPVALSRAESFPLTEVMDWVIGAAIQTSHEHKINTRLIASVNRQESMELAQQVLQAAVDRIPAGVVGVDLAGNEVTHPGFEFSGIFREARQAGLHITIHAGEWGGAENIRTAIEDLGAERIGHGVRVLEDPEVTRLARAVEIPFEVCVTSNYQSGVVDSLAVHPASRMLNLGLNVTFNTDDPSISQITLSDEYQQANQSLGLTPQVLHERILAAARATFLPETEKQQLIKALESELSEQLK